MMAATTLRGRFARWPTVLTWILAGILIFIALNAAAILVGHIPDYDGLVYVDAAMKVNMGLSGAGRDYFHQATGNVQWVGLPFTNTLNVLVAALLYNLIDYHIILWLLHTAYFVLFVVLLRRILRAPTVLFVVAWVACQPFFLHQYLNFISELEVGLFLTLFVAYLFHEDARRHLWALFTITVLLLLMRAINLAFIAPLVATFTVLRWADRGRRGEIWPVWKAVGLAVLLLSPLLAHEVPWLVYYVRKAGTLTGRNWQDMTGIYSKMDLAHAYRDDLRIYSWPLSLAALAAFVAALLIQVSPWRARLARTREYAIGAAVVFAVLMTALTNNIMVVFWVFALMGLFVAALLEAYVRPWMVGVAAIGVAVLALGVNHESYRRVNLQLIQRKPLVPVLARLSQAVYDVEDPVICPNYGGVGPIDIYAIEVSQHRKLGYLTVDTTSYSTSTDAYLQSLRGCNLAFVANRNFMWPEYLGINHQTEPVWHFMNENAEKLGFAHADRIEVDGDPTRTIDIYDRPSVKVSLRYLMYDDFWLEERTPVRVQWPHAKRKLDRYRLELEVMVPEVPASPGFTLPLRASLVNAQGREVGRVDIAHSGDQKLEFALDGLDPGTYQLQFDKIFQSPGDPRKLSALFRSAHVVFTGAPGS